VVHRGSHTGVQGLPGGTLLQKSRRYDIEKKRIKVGKKGKKEVKRGGGLRRPLFFLQGRVSGDTTTIMVKRERIKHKRHGAG